LASAGTMLTNLLKKKKKNVQCLKDREVLMWGCNNLGKERLEMHIVKKWCQVNEKC
jgi:hypothetical protein